MRLRLVFVLSVRVYSGVAVAEGDGSAVAGGVGLTVSSKVQFNFIINVIISCRNSCFVRMFRATMDANLL